MSELIITPDTDPKDRLVVATDADRIADELSKIGVAFERWNAGARLNAGADQAAVLDAYKADVERLRQLDGDPALQREALLFPNQLQSAPREFEAG